MIYNCCSENRRAAVLGNPTLNGIDYLEVLDHDAIALDSPRQQTLLVHCLKNAPTNLTPANVLITGGESITGITAQWIAPASPAPPQAAVKEAGYFTALADALNTLVVRTSLTGDFSPYVFRLVNNATEAEEDSFEVTEPRSRSRSRWNAAPISIAHLLPAIARRSCRPHRPSTIWRRTMAPSAPSSWTA
jgi:hypothetical protein